MGTLRRGCCCIILLVVLFIARIDAYAITIDNDGSAMEVPYGKCEDVPSSYEDLDYYDCYLPYKLTTGEIGGCSLTGLWDLGNFYEPMTQGDMKLKIGDKVNLQGVYAYCGGVPRSGYDSSAGNACLYTDANGNQVYAMAVQKFFFNREEGNFYGWDMSCRGQLIDVVLTDGTVIHFALGDTNAEAHTNGLVSATSSAASGDATKLNYKQYHNLFSATAGNCIELWVGTDVNSFMRKYGFKYDGTGNHIAFYRMYNGKLGENHKRKSGVGTEPAFNLDGVTISDNDESSESGDSSGSRLVSEYEILAMDKFKPKLSDDASKIELPDGSELLSNERVNVDLIKETINTNTKDKVIFYARVSVVFVGMLMLLYIILVVVAYSFDRVNNFIDFNLLQVITLGRFSISDDERQGQGYTLRRVIKLSFVCFIVGMLLVTGGIYAWIQNIIYWIFSIINSVRG